MEPVRIPDVIKDKEFIHQIKWDGIRGITFIENGVIRIFTKNGNECTSQYPELKDFTKQVNAKQAILDGELAVFYNGKPSFYHVLKRSLPKNEAVIKSLSIQMPVKYIIFDILTLNWTDVRKLPLHERQGILKACVSGSPTAALTDSFGDGEVLLELMKQKNMEGIVSKRLESVYTPGKRHGDWFKTKITKKLLCIVIGVNIKNSLPASLALGVFRGGDIINIGGVSSGLTQSDLNQLSDFMSKYKTGGGRDIIYVKPMLTCWVSFSEWTEHGTLRHPVLIGFSGGDIEQANGEELSV